MILLSKSNRYTSKHLITREVISLIWMITINNLFILPTLKAVLGWNILASLTHCMHASWDWSPIMLPLANIGQDFSLTILLHVYTETLLSKQEHIFCISVYGIWNHRILKRNPSKILLHFLSSICMYFVSKMVLHSIRYLLCLFST